MTDEQAPGFSTLAIHAGAAPDPEASRGPSLLLFHRR